MLGTCRTEYFCGGNSVELSIKGADTTHAWSGALRQLEVVRPAEQGPALERSAEWNLGRADVPYEGCVSLCFSDGATCGLDGCGGSCGRCGRGLDCDPDTRECVPDGLCRSDADCDGGLRCDTFIGACLDPNACVDSGPCGSTPCCAGSTCVAIDGQAECRTNCLGAAACASGCCLPLQSGAGSICAPAALCEGCANSNEPCSPIDNPCCPGMACIFVDGVGARCQTQSAACPAGCRNPAGSTCCRPPFCDGACRGSPCCQ